MIGGVSTVVAYPALGESTTVDGGSQYRAVVDRTEYGIPHITADNYGSLGFGYGYAFAQDNLCSLADHVLTLRGERSRYFGPDRIIDSGDDPEPVTNLSSDIFHRAHASDVAVQNLLSKPAPLGPTSEIRDLVAGYAAGYNHYLNRTGVENLPDPRCRGAEWVRPITPLDLWRNLYSFNRTAGSNVFRSMIAEAEPPTSANTARPTPVALKKGSLGSNAYALGREATRNGTGMLLANPHYPWRGSNRFYQTHLRIPGQLNVAGMSISGIPMVIVGHNDNVAWTHTVSTSQHSPLFKLRLVEGDPTSYIVNGATKRMTTTRVEVPVLNPDGTQRTIIRTLYSSQYGPVLRDGWTGETAYSIADPNNNNVRSLNEWLAMGKSRNLTELRRAQSTYQGMPFINTIASDSGGNAYLTDSSITLNVSDAQLARCSVTSDYPEWLFTIDGSQTSCAPTNDRDAIEPGIFGPAKKPSISRADYLTQSNDSLWLSNPTQPLVGYPKMYGDVNTARTLRTRLGLDMVAKRLAGTDGLGPAKFSLDSLTATTLGNRNAAGEMSRDRLVELCTARPVMKSSSGHDVDVRAACTALRNWDLHSDIGSTGAVLWRAIWLRIYERIENPYLVPFDPAQPLTTPRDLDTTNEAVATAFADGTEIVTDLITDLAKPLGDVQKVVVGGGQPDIPISGCTDDEEGCFNVMDTIDVPQENGVYDLPYGTSFLMATEFTRSGPQTRTLLTYSQSENPESEHHFDQTRLFSQKKWIVERFTPADIAADPKLKTEIVSSTTPRS
jgi:acyl-homoserine-lactone acylase